MNFQALPPMKKCVFLILPCLFFALAATLLLKDPRRTDPLLGEGNPAGGTLHLAVPSVFPGPFHNRGHIKVTDTVVRFEGAYLESGVYESDPSDNHFTDWTVSPGGSVTAGVGDRFFVSGDFTNGSLQNNTWNTGNSELIFSGFTEHILGLAGIDVGPSYTGYVKNFAWLSLRLAAGQALRLSDGNPVTGGALYVRRLILEGGLGQLAGLTGNGYTIYYDPTEAANGYLEGKTYPLAGGGTVVPVMASVRFLSTSILGNGAQRLVCQGVPLRNHTVKYSTDLVTFLPLATAMAAEDGTFTYDDPAAAGAKRRYYKVEFP